MENGVARIAQDGGAAGAFGPAQRNFMGVFGVLLKEQRADDSPEKHLLGQHGKTRAALL
jgi:hypothetical protein